MNATEFYHKLTESFGPERLNVWYFVNPLMNHRDFPEVQFIWPFGGSIPPVNTKATELLFADPLNGPFYKLPVEGAEFVEGEHDGDPHAVSLIVRLPNDSLSHSCAVFISGDPSDIRKEVGKLVDNTWYKIDLFSNPVRITRDEQLVQASGL